MGSALLVLVLSAADGRGWKPPFEGATLRMFRKYRYWLYVEHYPLLIALELLIPKFRIAPMYGSPLPEW